MNEIIKSFGNNAGKVWEMINKEGPQVETKLIKKTNITPNEFYGAVGWLARENKIYLDKRTYKIGDTNLTEKIGTSAGKIWNSLGSRNEIDISTIAKISKINKKDCYSALGWLACERKITAKITIKKR
jgi:hypothetical protein